MTETAWVTQLHSLFTHLGQLNYFVAAFLCLKVQLFAIAKKWYQLEEKKQMSGVDAQVSFCSKISGYVVGMPEVTL